MVGQRLRDAGQTPKSLHVGLHYVGRLVREKCLPLRIAVFVEQGQRLGKQFHTGLVVGLLPPVLEPPGARFIRVEVLPGQARDVRIGGARIAGEEEEVAAQRERPSLWGNIQIADLLEAGAAQCLGRRRHLSGQFVVGEMQLLGVPLLEGQAADLLHHGQVVAHRLQGVALLGLREILILADELFVQLSEGKVRKSEPPADKCLQLASRIDVGTQRGPGAVDTHPAAEPFDVAVQQAEKGHTGLQTALILAFDRLGIEPSRAGRKALDGLMDSQQQLLDPRIGLHGFAALAAETPLADIPQRGCTGKLAAELHHRSADRHAAHDRGLTRSGQGAPFQVEQNLATDFFHNDWFLGFPALGKDTVVRSVRRYAKPGDSENKTPCGSLSIAAGYLWTPR